MLFLGRANSQPQKASIVYYQRNYYPELKLILSAIDFLQACSQSSIGFDYPIYNSSRLVQAVLTNCIDLAT